MDWEVARWDSEIGWWYITGNDRPFIDSDFHLINETRIPSPDEVVVIADETCEMTPEMWRKLAERVKNKAQ